jgi:hypothetical protein
MSINDKSGSVDPSPMEYLKTAHSENSITSEVADSLTKVLINFGSNSAFFTKTNVLTVLSVSKSLAVPQRNTNLDTETFSSDGAVCTQTINPVETPSMFDSADLPTAPCKKKEDEISDQLATSSAEDTLRGRNQLRRYGRHGRFLISLTLKLIFRNQSSERWRNTEVSVVTR